jgi:ParB family chromosome partitioning protein
MSPKKNEACTLKPVQIIKNPDLALGRTKKNTVKHKKLAAEYGNVMPVIVCAQKNGTYQVISGSASLEACEQAGIQEVTAVLSGLPDEKEQMKLSLLLAALPDESSAIAEGAIISRLYDNYGVSPHEMMKLLGKSRGWVYKRMSLAKNLSETVKGMVTDGTLCPRSAEEVAKMPQEVQGEFAANVANAGMSKNDICALYKRYKCASTEEARQEVVKSPLSALSKTVVRQTKKQTPVLPGPGRHLQTVAANAARMLLNAASMAENASAEALRPARGQLCRLRDIMEESVMTLNRVIADSPRGERGAHDEG